VIRRTLIASLLLVAIVGGVIGALTVAIGHQHQTATRARHSEVVIAAANLTEQHFLAVQTNVRGYLIRGNPDVLTDYRAARNGLPSAAYDLRALVGDNPAQSRLADEIREQALSYVNDYADPVIARAKEGGVGAGRAFASANDGRARANALTERVHDFVSAEEVLSASRIHAADAAARHARLIALLGLAVCVLALIGATFFVARRIVRPVEQLAMAADRVRRGETGATVEVRGHDEIARLGSSFNDMARALEQSHDELESQNTELEMQAIALEERQEELSAAGDEARAQRDELSLIAAQLADEKRRAEIYGAFADRLSAERELDALARVALQTLISAAGADIGVMYTEGWRDPSRWARTAVIGLEPAPLADYAVAGGEGAAGRAVATRDVVHVRSGALRVQTLAGEVPVTWELHVPLTIGERALGVATLGGVSSAAFDEGESLLLTRLAGQAAVALAEGNALAGRDWLSQVNAAVLDGVREGIALVGLDHELVFANAAMEQLAQQLSMPIAAAIGARGADLSTAELDFDAYFAQWETILADSDEPTADELAVNGVVLERYTAPVDDDDGTRIGRLVVLRDVTREREAEQLKTNLMATVSHELRTPLASVLGYAELLRTRRLESAQREEILATVHREAKRLSALIDDFLDLQTIEQDRMELARAAFPVRELLSEAVTTFRGQSAAHEIVLDGAGAGANGSLVAFGDRARITQVVANLLSNAIKYSPAGGQVRVAATGGPGFVRVAVSDQGLGIPAGEQSRVFEKFFRVARPDHTVGGTGLGLALAHEIVEAHGGTMGFESTEGVGSTFWFTLPVSA
jgi:signal transduction histidine kinase